jgi:hypothetical protein
MFPVLEFSCKEHCERYPDTMFTLLFDIVDDNGNSLLTQTYPADYVVIYDIEDTTNRIFYWVEADVPLIGITYFNDASDDLGENHRKYGIKLNSMDIDTLEMFFTVKSVKCEYKCDSVVLFYNKTKYIKYNLPIHEAINFNFIKY